MKNNVRQRNKPILDGGSAPKRYFFSEEEFGKKRYPPLIASTTWFLIFFFYISIFLVVLYCDLIRFPSPATIESLQKSEQSGSLKFSEERARNFVTELSSIGSKPTGSYENEVVAVDYIMRQLTYIKSHTKPVNRIDIDLQKTSGCFDLTLQDGMTSCYQNVKNIVARIGPQKATNISLVINCHFDSVPASSGASDDVVSCAIMLEALLSLSQLDQALANEVIFLFNGAEENILQAAHGFITQHPWAKTAVGFVNMEACGAGGKQMLFQADRERTWLLLAYANGAPFPQGSVVAQDIFQNGLVPSDTDYRIFDQFGNIPGLDFAYVKNGYVYHTQYDVPEAITEGAIQQAGLNLLNLIHNALVSPDMRKVEEQSKLRLVFFDFMGIFMVVYRISVATAVNIVVILLSFVDMVVKSKTSGVRFQKRIVLVLKALAVMVFSLIAAYAFCATIAFLLNIFNATMSWYRSPYLVAGLYGCSSLAVIISAHLLTTRNESLSENWLKEDAYFDAARLIWIALFIVLELAKLNSSFISCIWVFFPFVIRGVIGKIFNLVGAKATWKSHVATHISMQVIPVSLMFYCVWSMYNVFIPIMGRIGVTVNPDLLVGLFTTLLVFLSTSYMCSLIQVMASSRKVIMLLLFIVATTFSLVCFTPLGFPYSGESDAPAPMRLYILHTERTFYNQNGSAVSQDSGYWVVPLDYNGPKFIKTFFHELKDAEPADCDAELACGMPFYMPVISLLRTSYYLPASKPKIHGSHKLQMVSKTLINSYTYRLSFIAQGPDHMTAIISPRPGVELTKWSLTDLRPHRSLDWVGRPTYFIYYSYGEYTEPWAFSIDLSIDKDYIKGSPLIDVSFVTHYLHGHDRITGDFEPLLNRIPSWVHATAWSCTLDMIEF